MNKLLKTKIVRTLSGEAYFQQFKMQDGAIVFVKMEKDLSSICGNRASKFKDSGLIQRTQSDVRDLRRPLPDNFWTDLISAYARSDYATGHEPMKPFSLR